MSALPTPEALTRTDRPITTLLELCLYRVVSERCGDRVLPFGVRQLIKEYAFVRFNNDTLREAVKMWFRNRTVAVERYGDINDWDVSQVTNMGFLFYNTRFNDRIDRWDVRNVTSMRFMFYLVTTFNQPLDTWNVSQVTTMDGMFGGATAFNQPLASWNVSQVTTMNDMFYRASSFNQPLSTWDVSQVTDMAGMFNGAESFNQPLDAWDGRRDVEGAISFHESFQR